MADDRKGRLVILSGPSCVGKIPLAKTLARWSNLQPVQRLGVVGQDLFFNG